MTRIAVPVVRIYSGEELSSAQGDPADVGQVLREINNRQWAAVREILIEAKEKAESMLRNDQIFDSGLRVAYYQGWVAYADYIIGNLESLRVVAREADTLQSREPEPGPE